MPVSDHIMRPNFCARCFNTSLVRALRTQPSQHDLTVRLFRNIPAGGKRHDSKGGVPSTAASEEKEPGPLARRLEEATEDVLFTGGVSGRHAIEDAGFSDDLKERLLHKIAHAKIKEQCAGSLSETNMTFSSSREAQDIDMSRPWTGTETTEDAVLRMLHDAKKPLKPEDRAKWQSPAVDTRFRRTARQSSGQRAAGARDKANMYVGMGMKAAKGLSDEEKDEVKAQLQERFQPAARSVPVSMSGLTALANQRIEDAISRGHFKNLPRGEKMERDPGSDNPFLDTTEYIMNKMIQRQEIVPPWIEKQQELTKAARVFRERLRNDWKRHASRMIASQGGSLEEQVKRAAAFAAAETAHNPRCQSANQITVPSNATHDPVMRNTPKTAQPNMGSVSTEASGGVGAINTLHQPFRDSAWEQTENAYMKLSIRNLNNITRSYNLMAPELAKKPYFSLERELNSCYADIAPLVANEIKVRAVGRKATDKATNTRSNSSSSLMEKFVGRDRVSVHLESDKKAYGLKEWWRDLMRKK